MARRFGGRYSPAEETDVPMAGRRQGHPAPRRFRIAPSGARVNLLFVAAAGLAFLSLGGGPERLALGLVGAALWALSGWLAREGLRAEAAWHDRKVARRPAVPRKLLAGLAAGLGTAIASANTGTDPLGAALYGVIAAGLFVTAFGLDPMRDKGVAGVDSFQQDRVARAVDEAEAHLRAMSDAIRLAQDRQLERRVERFQDTARALFRTVENDPRDLTAARKYLSVYLLGARDATARFAEVYARTGDPQARSDYTALLDDLEQNFAARTEKLLLNEHSDLTVEIEVLRDRLKREGVRPASSTNPQE
ncbi:MAG: 5-bromo-4-chloroindolyl phosphate hydrolysis family protein [Paracoccaceae bacterium]